MDSCLELCLLDIYIRQRGCLGEMMISVILESIASPTQIQDTRHEVTNKQAIAPQKYL